MVSNLEWYRIFLYTAKLGNLTKAAQELHMTQPSVSYAIKQLEASTGVRLFERQSKGVLLTPEGQALLEYVDKSYSLLMAGERHLESLKRLTQGELRIGASGPIFKHLLLPILDAFHASYPEIRIRLFQGKSSEIGQRLKEGQIDLGIVHLPLEDSGIEVASLTAIQDSFVVGSAYRDYAEAPLSMEQLTRIPLLLLSEGSSTRAFLKEWFAVRGCPLEADFELGSIDMLVEMAVRGYGAAFVTRSFVGKQLEEQQLFELRLQDPIPARPIGLALRSGQPLSLAAGRFIEMIRHAMLTFGHANEQG